ncbi:leucine-rich repeat protein [Artemisia annua]|uniref:Leucine-rich repeat protein n=1 Tax=Artemisia annua TaxID=35608 RepID=A0A2U1KIL3_ARTAN|nr:leucine-rich repeat protein [Artemisia annua]
MESLQQSMNELTQMLQTMREEMNGYLVGQNVLTTEINRLKNGEGEDGGVSGKGGGDGTGWAMVGEKPGSGFWFCFVVGLVKACAFWTVLDEEHVRTEKNKANVVPAICDSVRLSTAVPLEHVAHGSDMPGMTGNRFSERSVVQQLGQKFRPKNPYELKSSWQAENLHYGSRNRRMLIFRSGCWSFWTTNAGSTNMSTGCSKQEQQTLLKFKNTLGDDYGLLSSWVGNDCCSWRGVRCDDIMGSTHVVGLCDNGNNSHSDIPLFRRTHPLMSATFLVMILTLL